MKIGDLISQFRTTYDLGSLGLPGFEDDEIKLFLQIEQIATISRKFGGNNVYGQKFPDSKKRIDDLQGLMSSSTVSPVDSSRGYKLITLPSNYLHLVNLDLLYDDGTVENAIQIDYSKIQRFQNSRKNQGAYIKNPVYVFDTTNVIADVQNRKVRIYVDSTDELSYPVNNVGITYIQQPINLTLVGSEVILNQFNEDVYREIVGSALDSAIASVTPAKSQISQQQMKKSE